ncbi:hypothetical protein [Geitlerinema sp. PCC 7407]|uniref:hypothetical protein n=1 Tax=Geitlerinema sp. PCC 7407 TaxID=1173025 RepID=UPI00029FEF7C|nr:hypothetical protein GEI7407_1517 [Geitlerinema sp. PCC 7407]
MYRFKKRDSMNQPEAIAGADHNPTETTENSRPPESSAEKILCRHCLRTATNGIKCQGLCVADSDY